MQTRRPAPAARSSPWWWWRWPPPSSWCWRPTASRPASAIPTRASTPRCGRPTPAPCATCGPLESRLGGRPGGHEPLRHAPARPSWWPPRWPRSWPGTTRGRAGPRPGSPPWSPWPCSTDSVAESASSPRCRPPPWSRSALTPMVARVRAHARHARGLPPVRPGGGRPLVPGVARRPSRCAPPGWCWRGPPPAWPAGRPPYSPACAASRSPPGPCAAGPSPRGPGRRGPRCRSWWVRRWGSASRCRGRGGSTATSTRSPPSSGGAPASSGGVGPGRHGLVPGAVAVQPARAVGRRAGRLRRGPPRPARATAGGDGAGLRRRVRRGLPAGRRRPPVLELLGRVPRRRRLGLPPARADPGLRRQGDTAGSRRAVAAIAVARGGVCAVQPGAARARRPTTSPDGQRTADLVADTAFPADQTRSPTWASPTDPTPGSATTPARSPVAVTSLDQLQALATAQPDTLVLVLGSCDPGDPSFDFCASIVAPGIPHLADREQPAPAACRPAELVHRLELLRRLTGGTNAAQPRRSALHSRHAGLVSGDISAPRPTSPWRGDQAVPTGHNRSLLTGGPPQHAAAPTPAPRAVHRRHPRRARPMDRRGQEPPSATGSSSSATTTSATRSCGGPTPAATRSACRCSPRSTPRPTTSCSAACTSWPSRPTSSPATTRR